jgi:hypothetical protein
MTSAVAAKHFIDKGLPVNAAVALTCVLYYESKLNPGSQGNQPTERGGVLNLHGAYGIASWNGPRQQDLSDYAMRRGIDVALLTTQQDFVLNEIANHYPRSWAIIRSSATVSAIIAVVVDEYEDPADKAKEISGAFAFASPLLAAVKDYIPIVPGAPPIIPVPIPSIPAIPVPTGDLQMPIELILQLVAPLAESLVSGLLNAVLTHAQQTGTVPKIPSAPLPAPTLPPIDFAALAQLIAAELARLNPPKPAA